MPCATGHVAASAQVIPIIWQTQLLESVTLLLETGITHLPLFPRRHRAFVVLDDVLSAAQKPHRLPVPPPSEKDVVPL